MYLRELNHLLAVVLSEWQVAWGHFMLVRYAAAASRPNFSSLPLDILRAMLFAPLSAAPPYASGVK